jgi:uncharacterized iron-regulated membrane protein
MPSLGLVEILIITIVCDLFAVALVVAAYMWYRRRNQ